MRSAEGGVCAGGGEGFAGEAGCCSRFLSKKPCSWPLGRIPCIPWPCASNYGLEKQALPTSVDWTGAEIKSCCRLSALLDVTLVEAARQVVPVAATAAESVEKLRDWASGRCLSAAAPGLYQRTGGTAAGARRRVSRGSASN